MREFIEVLQSAAESHKATYRLLVDAGPYATTVEMELLHRILDTARKLDKRIAQLLTASGLRDADGYEMDSGSFEELAKVLRIKPDTPLHAAVKMVILTRRNVEGAAKETGADKRSIISATKRVLAVIELAKDMRPPTDD